MPTWNDALAQTIAAPSTANILVGAVTSTGTIITVPAGRTWQGVVGVSGVLAGGTGALNARPLVQTGAGAVPASQTLVSIELATPSSGAVTLCANNAVLPLATVTAPTTDVTVLLVAGGSNAATGLSAYCVGRLLVPY